MINFDTFYQEITKTPLNAWKETALYHIEQWKKKLKSKDKQFNNWRKIVQTLPRLIPSDLNLKSEVTAKHKPPLKPKQTQWITELLKGLMPWRKGPFSIYNININSEWRSDWKWERILPYLSPLKDKLVLDVGCGNGYYMWRMLGEGAKIVVGIDPSRLFFCQFAAIRKLIGNNHPIYFLPFSIEQVPPLFAFDTVFSMGVLYHRRSPLQHLCQLKNQLVPGGELVLESLVVKGDENQYLIPNGSYAKMRNVYFIPSAKMLKFWLNQCGFSNVHIVNQTITKLEEQRKTDWMQGESLKNFLNSNDVRFTIEGYPSPLRAVLIAKKTKGILFNIN